jgi:hypothetical protein
MIYSLLIINKAGGLIYNREYNEGINRLSSNDYLVLAGTFHGSPPALNPPFHSTSPLPLPLLFHTTQFSLLYLFLTYSVHAITAQISPVPNSSGLEVLETETFRLQCFQTHTSFPFPHIQQIHED